MTAPSPNSRRTALIAYRIFAWVTGVGLLVLCVFWGRELVLDHLLDEPKAVIQAAHKPVSLVGMVHGFLYMGYVACTLILAERCRWRPVWAILVALAGTIPLASFVAERRVTRLVRAEEAVGAR